MKGSSCIVILVLHFFIAANGGHLTGRKKKEVEDLCNVDKENLIIDCTNVNIFAQNAGIRMVINKCNSPVTMTLQIILKALDVDWSHEFSSNQDMAIPGFNYEFLSAFKTTVHAKTIIQSSQNQLRLKVSLRANVTVLGKLYSKEVKIFEQNLPFDAKCTQNASVWSSYSTGSKAGIVIGMICLVALIATVSLIIYRKRRAISLTTQRIQKRTGGKSGGNVMATVASYHNKQFEADKRNIKVAGKNVPQKFSPTSE